MKKFLRPLLLACAVFTLAGAQPAFAQHHHHHKHVLTHRKHVKHSNASSLVHDAQNSLINLGYYHSDADGKLGPKTLKAIKTFQQDHGMRVTGKLTRETYNAIIRADSKRAMAILPLPPEKPPASIAAAPIVLSQPGVIGTTNSDYADPLIGGTTVVGAQDEAQTVRTQAVSTRYAKLDINENTNGPLRRYNITLDGTPILQVDNQPSVIGLSDTYHLEKEDVLILTTYHDGDKVCPYKHYLLTLSQNRHELHTIGNCTAGYQARLVDESLFVTFPEVDDQRMAGSTWRYEGGDLEKL